MTTENKAVEKPKKLEGTLRMREILGEKFKAYRVWQSMRRRCNDKNHRSYSRYGARGIVVCERWGSFEAFYNDIGHLISGDLTLERKNVNAGYSPDNCTLIPRPLQARNTAKATYATINGQTLHIIEWAKVYGIPYHTIHNRIKRSGLTPEDAVMRPTRSYHRTKQTK